MNNSLRRIIINARVGGAYLFSDGIARVGRKMLGLGHPFVRHINEKQTARLRSWFLREFTPVLRRWQDMSETARPFRNPDEAVIWTVWLQGADEMPEDCRMYIDSVRKHNPNRRLEIVDLATVRQYVDIPEFILHRYEAGTVNAALLTDYIKFALLERYGGIWVDATVYQLRLAGEDILEYPMWSVKNLEPFPYDALIPDGRQWQAYFMAAQPHALFCKAMLDLLEDYMRRYETLVNYFASYYLASIARDIPAVSQSYKRVPSNNTKCEQLMVMVDQQVALNEEAVRKQLWAKDTWIYKGSRHLDERQRDKCRELLRLLSACDAMKSGYEASSDVEGDVR